MAKASGFTPKLGEKICDLLSQGNSVLAISKTKGMPSEATIRNWGREPKYSDVDFVANYARARDAGAHHEFDRIREIEDQIVSKEIDPHAARVLIDSIKWRLSKMLPRQYGDRQHVELAGGVAAPEHTPAIEGAPQWIKDRLAAGPPSVAAAAAISALDKPAAGNA